jgi:hypothetical protein
VTPQPFLTHDGQHRTELVVRFTHLQVDNLCFSLRKNHHGAINTVRIQTPQLRATDLTVALDGLGVLGQQLSLRSLPQITNTPLTQPRDPGFLPINLGNGLLNIGGTFRWVNTHGFQVQHLNVHNSPHQPECY